MFWTALSDVLSASDFDDIVHRLSTGDAFVGNGGVDDGVLLTGQASGLAHEGIFDNDGNSSIDDDTNVSTAVADIPSARTIFSISSALDAYDEMHCMALVSADADVA